MSNNRSGYTGVFYNNEKKKWETTINYKREVFRLGRFKTKEEAVRRRNLYIKLWNLQHKIQEVL